MLTRDRRRPMSRWYCCEACGPQEGTHMVVHGLVFCGAQCARQLARELLQEVERRDG